MQHIITLILFHATPHYVGVEALATAEAEPREPVVEGAARHACRNAARRVMSGMQAPSPVRSHGKKRKVKERKGKEDREGRGGRKYIKKRRKERKGKKREGNKE